MPNGNWPNVALLATVPKLSRKENKRKSERMKSK